MFLITLPFKTFGAIDVDASFNVFSEVKLILNGAKKNTATKTAEQSTGPKILISRLFLDIIVKLPLVE
ncbi:hypothetical protein EF01_07370 [Enterococcus faecalis]